MIRVIIADDHTLVRQGIRALIERNKELEVVSECSDGVETLELTAKKHPDVLVMDISMPKMTGTQVMERMRADHFQSRVVILSMYSDDILIRQALKLGAKAYLLKNSLKEELIEAIQVANRGELYVNQTVSEVLSSTLSERGTDIINSVGRLTLREKEILKLIAEGHTNSGIANILHLSVKTIEKHRSNLLDKLKVTDTAGLIRLAIKYHLIFIDGDQTDPVRSEW